MIIYFTEKPLTDEIVDTLRKNHPRSSIKSNYFEIPRASDIDYKLLLDYFSSAITKEHNLYKVAITLPRDLEDRIPFWFVQSDGQIWVDPNSGPRGKNIYKEDLFVLKFQFYIDEEDIHKFPEIKDMSIEKTLILEFEEIRYALIDGNEEPINIFKDFYTGQGLKTPRFHTGKYLASVLTTAH